MQQLVEYIAGIRLAAGVYLLRLDQGGVTRTMRAAVLQ